MSKYNKMILNRLKKKKCPCGPDKHGGNVIKPEAFVK